MDLFWQISLTVFGAVFGAALSLMVPVIVSHQRYKKRPDLLGTWKSAYRPDFRNGTTSVIENVEIDLHFGELRMRNRNNLAEDSYIVHAELVERIYIVGRWASLKPGANAFGAIILTISPLGNVMYGFFTGLGDTGERTYCGWVLTRSEQDLGKAVDLLSTSGLPLVPSKVS